MDENSAWKKFTVTGSIEDYLAYCQTKTAVNAECINSSSEDIYENQYRGTDTDGTNSR